MGAGTFLITDPFYGLDPGSGPPSDWLTEFGSGVVYGFANPPQPGDDPGGIYPYTGEGANDQYRWFRDQASIFQSPDLSLSQTKGFNVFFAFRIPSYQGPHNFLQLNSKTMPLPLFPDGQDTSIMQLTFENDMTLSWLGGAGVVSNNTDGIGVAQYPQVVGRTLCDNSGFIGNGRIERYNFNYDVWYYAWLNVTWGQNSSLPGTPITIGGTLTVNGDTVLTVLTTPLAIGGDDFPGGPYLSEVIFLNPGTLDLALIFVQENPAFDYPAPMPKRAIRESQGVVEVAARPSHELIRINQGIIELSKLPSNSSVRISQMVIELPPGSAPTPSGGGRVWEA